MAHVLLTASLLMLVNIGWLPAEGSVDHYNVCATNLEGTTLCEEARGGLEHTMAIPFEWAEYSISVQACPPKGDCGVWSDELHLVRASSVPGDMDGDGVVGVDDYVRWIQVQKNWGQTDLTQFMVCTPVEAVDE